MLKSHSRGDTQVMNHPSDKQINYLLRLIFERWLSGRDFDKGLTFETQTLCRDAVGSDENSLNFEMFLAYSADKRDVSKMIDAVYSGKTDEFKKILANVGYKQVNNAISRG